MTRGLFVTVCAALLAASCSDLIGVDPTSRESAAPDVGGIQLTLSASRSEISPGDTVRLTARLFNGNPTPVRLDFSNGCQILPFLENASGKVVYPYGGGWGCIAVVTSLELAPGETKERVWNWTGQDERFQPGTTTRVYTALPAGSYQAYAMLDKATMNGTPIQLQSSRITIRVR